MTGASPLSDVRVRHEEDGDAAGGLGSHNEDLGDVGGLGGAADEGTVAGIIEIFYAAVRIGL